MLSDTEDIEPPAADRFWRELDGLAAKVPHGVAAPRLAALGPAPRPVSRDRLRIRAGVPPYANPREHLADLAVLDTLLALHLVQHDVAAGILPSMTGTFQSTVRVAEALAAEVGPTYPPAALADHIRGWYVAVRDRTVANLAARVPLPFVETARRYSLSTAAAHALSAVVTANAFPALGRLYGLLAGREPASVVTRGVLARALGNREPAKVEAVLRELSPGAALDRFGLVQADGEGLDAALTVDAVLVAHLRGDSDAALAPGCRIRTSFLTYEELWLSDDARRFLDRVLSRPRKPHDPGPVIVRGREASGRRTLAAALAARVGRRLTVIDVSALVGDDPAASLAVELRRAALRNTVPCVDQLEHAVRHQGARWRDRLGQVIDAHPGLVFVIALPEDDLRISRPICDATLGLLGRDQQRAAWLQLLPKIIEASLNLLLDNFDLAPGAMAARVRDARAAAGDDDEAVVSRIIASAIRGTDAALAMIVRQRVPPAWPAVAAPPDWATPLRESLAWPGGRSVRSLIYGPPGAGKSFMARALVGPRCTAEVDVEWLLGGDPVAAAGRVELFLRELEGGRRALVLEQLDQGMVDVDPELLRRFAMQLWRLRIPVLATANQPEVPWPFDTVFPTACFLANNVVRRADAWHIHLGRGRVDGNAISAVMDLPLTMAQIGRAAALVEGVEAPTGENLRYAVTLVGADV